MSKKKWNCHILKDTFYKTLPVLTGYLAIGVGFGLLMQTKGYSIWLVLGMSIFVYAGSMQYVGVNLLSSGASLITIAATTLMVNARHLFYGISMIDAYKGTGKKKPYLIFALTDETYSLVCSEKGNYFLISLFNQCYWVIGSVLGYFVGTFIAIDTTGIDFAMTALFITVLVEQWLSTRDHFPAMLGVTVSVGCLVLFGAKQFLIPAMIIITFVLLLRRKIQRNEVEHA